MDILPAEGLLAASWLLIALPLVGAAVLLLGGRRTDRWGHLLGTATVVAAFVIGLLCTFQLAGLDGKPVDVDLFTFISTGDLDVRAGLLFDPLSAIFVLLITGVGSLIHIYSVGYMAHDPGRRAAAPRRRPAAARSAARRQRATHQQALCVRPRQYFSRLASSTDADRRVR